MKRLFGYTPEEVDSWKRILFIHSNNVNAQGAIRFLSSELDAVKIERDEALTSLRAALEKARSCNSALQELESALNVFRNTYHVSLEDQEYSRMYKEILKSTQKALNHSDII